MDDVRHYSPSAALTSVDAMTPALEICGLTVRYGGTTAVHDLDLSIARGETVALLGTNGAGKSSTVNAALGLFRPTAGTVELLGREPLAAVRSGGVGAMLQHGGLPSESRVGEVLRLVREVAAQGMTIVMATHEMGFAKQVAVRVVFLDGGRGLEAGPPSQELGDPVEQAVEVVPAGAELGTRGVQREAELERIPVGRRRRRVPRGGRRDRGDLDRAPEGRAWLNSTRSSTPRPGCASSPPSRCCATTTARRCAGSAARC